MKNTQKIIRLPSFRSSECESIIVCVLGTHTYPDNALACHGYHTPTDYGDPPGKGRKKKGDFRITWLLRLLSKKVLRKQSSKKVRDSNSSSSLKVLIQ